VTSLCYVSNVQYFQANPLHLHLFFLSRYRVVRLIGLLIGICRGVSL
jgi:hypothetical protein